MIKHVFSVCGSLKKYKFESFPFCLKKLFKVNKYMVNSKNFNITFGHYFRLMIIIEKYMSKLLQIKII